MSTAGEGRTAPGLPCLWAGFRGLAAVSSLHCHSGHWGLVRSRRSRMPSSCHFKDRDVFSTLGNDSQDVLLNF